MARWHALLAEHRRLQTELLRVAPFRDVGLVPNPAAPPRSIEAAERRLGRRLPPSYREFLSHHNGWPLFYEGATLLGTADLGKRSYDALLRAVFDAADTPVPDVGPPSRLGTAPALIPFGIDRQATTLFAFVPDSQRSDGELEVVAWINEIGVRRDGFADLLELVCDLAAADLEALTTPKLARAV